MPSLAGGLSARLLLLTIVFVMVAEVLIYVPSISYRRVTFMEERLGQGHLALLGLESSPDGMVDPALQTMLLSHAGAIAMKARRPHQSVLMLGPDMPHDVDRRYDLRTYTVWDKIADAYDTLVFGGRRVVEVTGWSPKDPAVLIRVYAHDGPMRMDMLDYSWRILGLSLMISLITAALVFLALTWLTVRPIRRLTAAMAAFSEAPDDPARVIQPSGRRDELGMAEEALRDMQNALRDALNERARLAGVGTAVAKITHDLKGILTTALLESDRLETSADPEVKHITQGIAQAVERAISLCASTLRFAKEGPPLARPQPLVLDAVVRPLMARMATLHPTVDWRVEGDRTRVVHADEEHLNRILSNLLANAAEAKAARVTLRVLPGERRGRIALEVADDGPGLPARARDNLFQPFSGSARPGGTGLGLPIAHDLARAQSGSLVLVATGPEGTVFRLELP
jgi:signal transduction histidine kinase